MSMDRSKWQPIESMTMMRSMQSNTVWLVHAVSGQLLASVSSVTTLHTVRARPSVAQLMGSRRVAFVKLFLLNSKIVNKNFPQRFDTLWPEYLCALRLLHASMKGIRFRVV